jgi:4'-phosphopantetheinyl transferase
MSIHSTGVDTNPQRPGSAPELAIMRFPTVIPPLPRQRLAVPTLQAGALHLWGFALSATPAHAHAWAGSLSAQELERAHRFTALSLRTEFVVAHGILRHLLASYCEEQPPTLQFGAGGSGKPILLDPRHQHIRFNLAHSHGRALIAVSRNLELGVDLEQMRPEVDVQDLANRFFFGSEIAAIRSAQGSAQRDAFFRYWVAKEAVLKAQGVGFGFPLDRFGIRFSADGTTASVESSDPARLSPDWRVRMLPCGLGWAGAVAARDGDWVITVHTPGSPDH